MEQIEKLNRPLFGWVYLMTTVTVDIFTTDSGLKDYFNSHIFIVYN